MLRTVLLTVSGDPRVRRVVSNTRLTRGVVSRFVAGEDTAAAVAVAGGLRAAGLWVSLDILGEDATDRIRAQQTVAAYRELLDNLAQMGLTPGAEVSVKLSALGGAFDAPLAYELALSLCRAARAAGTCVTVDMEDHTTTDATLATVARLRRDFPETGAVVQAYLRRTEADCRDLAKAGGRVRLCKGAYAEPRSVAYTRREEVDASYARCLGILMAGKGYPMVATHDPALIALAARLSEASAGAAPVSGSAAPGGPQGSPGRRPFEYQMLYGVRSDEQRRLAGTGEVVRVYVPCGREWYGYLMRRLAERPANLRFALRALRSTS